MNRTGCLQFVLLDRTVLINVVLCSSYSVNTVKSTVSLNFMTVISTIIVQLNLLLDTFFFFTVYNSKTKKQFIRGLLLLSFTVLQTVRITGLKTVADAQ